MRLETEIERQRQRVQKTSIKQALSTLRMLIVKDETIPQDLTEWDLHKTVESK